MNELPLVILCVTICMVCFYTDVKYGKIKNVVIFPATVIALILNVIYSLIKGLFADFILSFAAITISSLLMYFLRIWGAGDSKFLIFVIVSMPASLYNVVLRGYFGGISILMFIFVIAFAYLLIESVVFFVKKTEILKTDEKPNIRLILVNYFGSISIITALNMLFYFTLGIFYVENQYLLMLINFFIVICIGKIKFFSQLHIVVIFTVIIIPIMLFSGYMKRFVNADYKFPLIFLVILILKGFMNRYNYKKITPKQLKRGMVLSVHSAEELMQKGFKPAAIPKETLKSQITSTDIEQITKLYDENEIYIVRNIPFGSIIAVGTILFVGWRIICTF